MGDDIHIQCLHTPGYVICCLQTVRVCDRGKEDPSLALHAPESVP